MLSTVALLLQVSKGVVDDVKVSRLSMPGSHIFGMHLLIVISRTVVASDNNKRKEYKEKHPAR